MPTSPVGPRMAWLAALLLVLLCVLPGSGLAVEATASVGDHVWLDDNGNGLQDAGEPGIANLLVTLYRGDGTVQASMPTDANGNYRFANLLPGTYQLKFTTFYGAIFTEFDKGDDTLDSDCDRITGLTPKFTLAEGETNNQWDAGMYRVVMFGNAVWYDLNANGIQDTGEPRAPHVPVRIYGADGTLLLSGTTNANGIYEVYGPPGTYSVQFIAPAGYTFTQPFQGPNRELDSDVDPLTGKTAPFTLYSDQIDCGKDAGLVPAPAQIGDLVWIDADADGLQGANETGLAGVTVALYNADGLVATTTTDASGHYLFTVPGGAYYVRFILPAGYTPAPQDQGDDDTLDSDADPTTGKTVIFTVANGQIDRTRDAALVPLPAMLGDCVWLDANANGLQDTDEAGVPGVAVTLYNAAGKVVDNTTTDAQGMYAFTVPAGVYYVAVMLPDGYAFTIADAGDDDALDSDVSPETGTTTTITLANGQTDLRWDAGLVALPATIGDRVWIDANKNGVQDAGEAGLAGVTVRLYDTDDTLVDTTTTGANGLYSFTVPAGGYYLQFILPAGYAPTVANAGNDDTLDSDPDPLTGKTAPFTVANGQTDLTHDGGLYPRPACVGDTVWLDTNGNGRQNTGEPGVAGVTVDLYATDGTLVDTTTTDAQGKYHFSVEAGSYYIAVSLPAGFAFTLPNQGSNDTTDSDVAVTTGETAVFTLVDGQTDLRWDAGLVPLPPTPGLAIVKDADVETVVFGKPVTYTYTVTNTGETVLKNIKVTDDNGTPDMTADDFTVGTIAMLASGEERTLTATVYPWINLYATINGKSTLAGRLSLDKVGCGDIKVTYAQSRAIIDNTYGRNAVGYTRGHSFEDLLESDLAQFQFTNAQGTKVLDFTVDYLSASRCFPSRYGSLGVCGDEGEMLQGNRAYILSATTSMSTNLNQSSAFYGYTCNSPAEPNAKWDYVNSYTLVVSKAAFGCAGFGSVSVPMVHNSPSKNCVNKLYPVAGATMVTNTATATACAPDGTRLTATSTATVQVTPAVKTCPQVSISSNFNCQPICAGRTIWFSSVIDAKKLGKQCGSTTITMTKATITFAANGTTYEVPVPDAVITYSSTARKATTTYDAARKRWVTVIPRNASGDAFLAGVAFKVPKTLPGGITPVKWQATFTTDTPDVQVDWKWAAAVYSKFATDYNALGVLPVEYRSCRVDLNAGTPMNYIEKLVAGARGYGYCNFTGCYTASRTVTPCVTVER